MGEIEIKIPVQMEFEDDLLDRLNAQICWVLRSENDENSRSLPKGS